MDREILVDKMMTFLPVLYKKFFRGLSVCEISRQQLELLYYLSADGGKPMTHYCSKMMVPKPNLTVMADKLIEEGYIEREFLASDRRVIILKLTKKGEDYLFDQREKFMHEMLRKLEVFDDNDITRLYELMEETRSIFSKIEETE